MMNGSLTVEDAQPRDVIAQLVAKHGRWSVWVAVLALMMQRKPKPVPGLPQVLNNHLLRDLGLAPVPDAPRDWDIRP